MPADALPDTLWSRLSEFIAAKTGLHFPPERRADLQRGLTDAAAEFGFADTCACADWLLSAPLTGPQLSTLASHLTIGETYFFRERKALGALAERVLPELIRRRRGHEQRLRLWSAACSTGEEPYSLAILLHELLPDWRDWQVTILATDINTRFLQKAVAGVYGEWSFRESPPEFKERYFTRTSDRSFTVAPQIRKRVSFAQLNLARDGFPSLATNTNAMDVILCRNLLIYFTPPQAHKLVENLRHALLDDGWLVVSPSECSQALFSRFVTVNFPGAILYRKSDAAERIRAAWNPAAWTVAPLETAKESAPLAVDVFELSKPGATDTPSAERFDAQLEGDAVPSAGIVDPCTTAESLYGQGRYPEAVDTLLSSFALATQTPAPSSKALLGPPAFSLLSRALANQGKLTDALAWSERWVAADKLDASAHYLHAMILQELGERTAARRSLQRAIYVQPGFVLAHFALGNCARHGAPSTEANKHFQNALRLLRDRPPNELVPGSDGLTAGRLTEIICALSSQGPSSDEKRKS
jgi:chemotaxis protein methyltransferase CheR